MLENVNSCTVQFYTPFKCRIVCLLKISEPLGVIFMKTSGGENGEHFSFLAVDLLILVGQGDLVRSPLCNLTIRHRSCIISSNSS
jgi:hypothetical protein